MIRTDKKTEIVTIWFIRDLSDRLWQSVMFKSEQEAQEAINGSEMMEEREPYSVQFPVRYDAIQMDYAARAWVAENFENYSIGQWSTADCWEFIDANHSGGSGGFILNTCLDTPATI